MIIKRNKRKIVCITGMHRSGTSLTAKILNICGLFLGKKDDLIGPLKGNPLGHWENRNFVEINDSLISTFLKNKYLSAIPEFPDNLISSSKTKEAVNRAKRLVSSLNSKHDLWGWKDPRTCLTISFWKKIIGNKADVYYIVPLREWDSVAKSLKNRDDFPFYESIDLFSNSLMSLYKNLPPRNTYFFKSKNLINNYKKEVSKIIKFIDSPKLKFGRKQSREIKKYIRPSLWHHSSRQEVVNKNIFENFLITNFFNANQYLIKRMREKTKIIQELTEKIENQNSPAVKKQ